MHESSWPVLSRSAVPVTWGWMCTGVGQTIEFPDDELVEPLEGLDIAEDGIELPPPPPPEPEKTILPPKPNLLVRATLLLVP